MLDGGRLIDCRKCDQLEIWPAGGPHVPGFLVFADERDKMNVGAELEEVVAYQCRTTQRDLRLFLACDDRRRLGRKPQSAPVCVHVEDRIPYQEDSGFGE